MRAGLNILSGKECQADLERTCDVVVVGSGPGGSAVAARASAAGLSVIVVEAGDYVPPDKYPADAFGAMTTLYRDMGATVTRGRAPVPYLQGRAVGGTSVINGAISWRLPEDVYQEWIANDPALAESLSWAKLEQEHNRIEAALNIRPTDPDVAGANNALLARGAEALGIEHRPIRRNVRECKGLGRCLQGCPGGAKQSMDQTLLRTASAAGSLILSNVRVQQVLMGSGRALGVQGTSTGGAHVTVKASAVVLAASAVQTPVLLLQSGLRSGPVGRHFTCHPGASMTGRFREPVNVWVGATQGHEGIGLRREGIKFEALGFDITIAAMRTKGIGTELSRGMEDLAHRAHWGAAVRASAEGRVKTTRRGEARVKWSAVRDDIRKVRRGLAVLGEMMLAAGAEYVEPGVFGWDERVEDRKRIRELEEEGPLDPRAYPMAVTHMFGTCRMGSDPATSVVNPQFEHHAVKGLFVSDSSVFPSNTGVNPQTSILALASVCGDRVVDALSG